MMLCAVMCHAQEVSLEVRTEKPYGWVTLKDGSSISFGTLNFGEKSTKEMRLYVSGADDASGVELSVSSDEFAVSLGDGVSDDSGDTYYPLTLTATAPATEGDYEGEVHIGYAGEVQLSYVLKQSVKDLNCATIAQLREKGESMKYGTRLFYTGLARINFMDKNFMSVSDSTGSVELEGVVPQNVGAGCLVRFTTKALGNLAKDNHVYAVYDCVMNTFPNWEYPVADEVSVPPTTADYGRYIRMRHLSYQWENVIESQFPNADGFKPRYMRFADAEGQEYRVYPPHGSTYASVDTLWLRGKDLELTGFVIDQSETGGANEPWIYPICIRPMEPSKRLPVGEYTMAGWSFMWSLDESWTTRVDSVPGEPYLYVISKIGTGMGGNIEPVLAEANEDATQLRILTGQRLWAGSDKLHDDYLAAWSDFTVGSDEWQEPLPKGTWLYLDYDAEADLYRFDKIFDLAQWCHGEISGIDPKEYVFTHYGIWRDGTLSYNLPFPVPTSLQTIAAGNSVVLSWVAPEKSKYTLTGYKVLCNGQEVGQTDAQTTLFANSNMRDGTYSFTVEAVYEEGVSEPSEASVITLEGTDIQSVEAQDDTQDVRYNALGMRVGADCRGLVITKGRNGVRKTWRK